MRSRCSKDSICTICKEEMCVCLDICLCRLCYGNMGSVSLQQSLSPLVIRMSLL